ncbi:hypothetical protein [Corynebacterium singulare]|uniref:Uncharacterized protein n=1 Tax=Corynebacterium singulare TaxID=161899 RepID=A0A0B6EXC7_9CORY|nr:hypothetical protein [Corynebacterium singulare]AJI79478.1 hypothetical protein CSING_09825 [Corynebacterium singulare]
MIYTPATVELPVDAPIKRVPPRNPEDRQPNYLKKFDYHTVFSDIFVNNGKLWFIGPRWENLERELRATRFEWNWNDITQNITFESLNRMSRATAPVSDTPGILIIDGPLGYWEVEVPCISEHPRPEGHLLVTQQQDNRLEWIAYWAFYNSLVNNTDTIIVYDNNSSLYSAERVDQVLSLIPGIKHHVVVKWGMPYGPTGGPNNVWDSDYSQHVAWEHSRRFFAPNAKSVLMIDIDELPIHVAGKSLPEALEESNQPVLHFSRQPIRQFPNRSKKLEGVRVHADYSLGEERGAWLAPKYIYSPQLINNDDQLMAHVIRGEDTTPAPSDQVFAGHFDAIRIRWRFEEKTQIPNFNKVEDIVEPTELSRAFNEKFDKLDAAWRELLPKIAPVINSQGLPHID